MINSAKALEEACKQPTLAKALSWIVVWETERILKTYEKTKPYESCYEHCIKLVLDKWILRE